MAYIAPICLEESGRVASEWKLILKAATESKIQSWAWQSTRRTEQINLKNYLR